MSDAGGQARALCFAPACLHAKPFACTYRCAAGKRRNVHPSLRSGPVACSLVCLFPKSLPQPLLRAQCAFAGMLVVVLLPLTCLMPGPPVLGARLAMSDVRARFCNHEMTPIARTLSSMYTKGGAPVRLGGLRGRALA